MQLELFFCNFGELNSSIVKKNCDNKKGFFLRNRSLFLFTSVGLIIYRGFFLDYFEVGVALYFIMWYICVIIVTTKK